MSCLFCKCFQAIEPDDHRKEREAGTCQSSCGLKWDASTAARYVRRHKHNVSGLCRLNPTPATVRCDGICAKFEDGFYSTWNIGQPGEHDNLADWARETMQTYIYGDWKEQERERLTQENKTLKLALKAARERSAARLVRLNKVAKRKARPKPALRLVAAE